MPYGIAAGQAWECEREVDLAADQQAKTGALFAAATAGGAVAGAEGEAWRSLGEAYQVADDVRDLTGDPEQLGEPVGQDAAHGRSTAIALGLDGGAAAAHARRRGGGDDPPCPGHAELRALILLESRRLLPAGLAQQAA